MLNNFFKIILPLFYASCLIFHPVSASLQHAEVAQHEPKSILELIPTDPKLVQGTLDNGFRYYIRQNNQPQGYVHLQLIVNVGSNVEAESERGLAHFIEHLPFKGTKHFPNPNDTIAYFASHGVRFGADLNAYTTQEETSYLLSIPNSEEIIDKSICWLSDCAGFTSLTPEAIETERPIILDEMQMRNTAEYRSYTKVANIIGRNSPYADHFPIGNKEIIQGATTETIKQFYKKWYRPELMAVIAVGDFNPQTIETLIKNYFGKLIASDHKMHAPHFTPTPLKDGIFIHTDKEIIHPTCSILTTKLKKPLTDSADIKQLLISSIISYCLNLRIQEQLAKPSTNLLGCFYSESSIFKTLTLCGFLCTLKNENTISGIQEAVTLAKQTAEYGFTDQEINAAKQAITANLDVTLANLELLNHQVWCQNYYAHFTASDQTAIAKQDDVVLLQKAILETITSTDINYYAATTIPHEKFLTIYTMNSKDLEASSNNVDESSLRDALATTLATQLQPYQAKQNNLSVLHYPSSSAFTNTTVTTIEELDAHKITLANGIVVYAKKTAYEKDNIYLMAQRPGGVYHHKRNAFIATQTPNFATMAGFAGLKPHEIAQQLSSKQNFSITEIIGTHWTTLLTSCTHKDFLFMLELLLTKVNLPNKDADTLELLKSKLHQQIANKEESPQMLYEEFLTEQIYQHDYLFKPLTHTQVDQLSLETLITTYEQHFKDLNAFTFAVVGDFNLDTLLPVLENTLGKLEQTTNKIRLQEPIIVKCTTNNQTEAFTKKSAEQCLTTIVFPFGIIPSKNNMRMIHCYVEILKERLFEKLRLQNNKVYSPYAYVTNLNNFDITTSDTSFRLIIPISSEKDAVDMITKLVVEELTKMAQDGVSGKELEDAKKKFINQLHHESQSNIFWLNFLLDTALTHHEEFVSLETITTNINNISLEEFKEFIQNLINPKNYYALSLLPEEKKAT